MTLLQPSPIDWRGPAFDGDNRIVGFCGSAAVGAVFIPSGRRTRYWRWRAWYTTKLPPTEGVARTEADAKREVEEQFDRFRALAKLTPIGAVHG